MTEPVQTTRDFALSGEYKIMLFNSPRIVCRFALALMLAMLILPLAGCTPKPPAPTPKQADLELDQRLWHIYTRLQKVRNDVKDTIKNNKITPELAQQFFESNQQELEDCLNQIKILTQGQTVAYSPQLQELSEALRRSVVLAHDAYHEKRIADITAASELVTTVVRISKDIPIRRTMHLMQLGCSVDKIYEEFRKNHFEDEEIQEFILEAQRRQKEEPQA